MKHFGDITKINGAVAPPVNVIIGGSPCQDLSIAGKRAGLAGERSGLFMEQLRVIKEMRKADADRGKTGTDIRPRFMVWENVPGAFSSNKGADFGAVLQETVRVVYEKAPAVPIPKNGWPTAGCLTGGLVGQWSVAWRVFDAQFWGVPQRRRRIALIADFGGYAAPEILFERESVCGYYPQGKTPWERATGAVRSGAVETSGDIGHIATFCLQGNGIDRSDNAGCNGKGWTEDVSYTLNTIDRPAVYDARGNGDGRICPTMTGDHNNRITDYTAIVLNDQGGNSMNVSNDVVGTLRAEMNGHAPVVMGFSQIAYDSFRTDDKAATLKTQGGSYGGGSEVMIVSSVDCRNATESKINGALQSRCSNSVNANNIVRQQSVVRRLTPLECERLQGFPDGWTDIGTWTDSKGKVHPESTDSARYKALGNSIAIPPWFYVLQKLSLCCGDNCTMASLFDGIGGFPYIWEMLNGKGSCLWASEIEEFPIAVTKIHFAEKEDTHNGTDAEN